MQTIGERLEDARKKKGISIREAAEATKIRGDYLQKFESNHFDIGLTEIYARGFLRGYANFLKLPADRLLADYAALGRGDVRPRQPNREIYGRMDISVSSAGEPSDRAAPPAEGGEEPAPARSKPHYPRRSGTALPTGPDPAVVFQYLKIGGVVALVIVIALLGRSMFVTKPAAPETPAVTKSAPAQPAPAPGGASFTLVATDVVHVSVYRKVGENETDELFKGWLARGETKTVAWNSEVYIRATEGRNLKIEIGGKRHDAPFTGNGRLSIFDPPR